MVLSGVKGRGRPQMKRRNLVEKDMRAVGLDLKDAMDCAR